jgi:hypothetical protein
MCPYNKACNCLISGFLATTIFCCHAYPHECPHRQRKEPDLPEKSIPFMNMAHDGVVLASGSSVFSDSGLGTRIGELSAGVDLYFVKPQNIKDIGGKFTMVSGDRIVSINFEVPPQTV